MKSVLKGMIKQKRGHIINILSVAANTVFEDSSVYSASKAGLLAMSNSVREEVRRYNIKVSNLLPGAVENNHVGRKKQAEIQNQNDVPC